ncbi:MAG: trypsin-like peptidase domain-containing protein [Saprospiraceae bacterium]|uniref:Trypsin-like peptidase domain-containing protein n=1 Tax=Candidatus Defluviibacterium haderslevense TaxID=2981993 RepID=A0A9D7XCI2_9BACT|nr:trypsin-like peptidase domain-containing protein [Candidatus Defluviibacterium haderslevense]MBL0236031.1 trypsin-like peptidase domain-containing protein [Candidatus Defluviibacterium haderslevense]
MKYIPYTFPSTILEFMHKYMTDQMNDLEHGVQKVIKSPSIAEYYATIPYVEIEKHHMEYHNALLRTFQLMTNEGLITPLHNSVGFDQEFHSNGFDPRLAKYGQYDFPIFGFQYLRDLFEDAVKPIILNQGNKDRIEDIGTGFIVNSNNNFDDNFYFVTARHCIPPNARIYVPAFLPPKKPCVPEKIYVPENDQIDLAVIKFVLTEAIPGREQNFWMGSPEILDEILTMGYPPIQGFIDAIQVAEVSKISSFLKTTEGRITGKGKHYWGGKEDHFLISARVKGGNSGGPVVNKKGEVVGVIIELFTDGGELDKLGYGVALNVHVLRKMIEKIKGISSEINIKELEFAIFENGFEIK